MLLVKGELPTSRPTTHDATVGQAVEALVDNARAPGALRAARPANAEIP